jgi:hypothetical protein
MTQATLYEVIAGLAGIVARLANLTGYPDTGREARSIQLQLEGEAELFEVSEMVDPFEAA